MKRENKFQSDLICEIKERFPGCMVLKNDSGYIQGIPDLTILFHDKWATLECKKSASEPFRPNQKHYVNEMDRMSFSRVIYPENKEDVLNDLQQSFES